MSYHTFEDHLASIIAAARDSDVYQPFKTNYNFKVNNDGSAASMEPTGIRHEIRFW